MVREGDLPEEPETLAAAGTLLLQRSKIGHSVTDLDKAIIYFESSIRLTPDESDEAKAQRLGRLGVASRARLK